MTDTRAIALIFVITWVPPFFIAIILYLIEACKTHQEDKGKDQKTNGLDFALLGLKALVSALMIFAILISYRGLELSNELRVLLVSDPTTDKSAVAMDVNVGHLMDSWDLPGTAHFAEHMLFLGTAKYPEEDEYSKFIASNAGMSNAFTAPNHTNYHFDVKPDQLQGALDRFVQFFLTPQFTESATEREVCAVDSEHLKNLKNDGWRNMQVDRHMSKPGHDYGKFNTGNKKTLMEDARTKGIEPREALLEFHKQWYSSNIMCLCIVGKESLDELENLVTSLYFGSIENKSGERKQWLDHPYQGESLGKRIEVVPVKDTRSLKLVFPMPDLSMEYKSQPAHYFSHLIGHEAKGSLLSELKRRGWASSLFSGHDSPASGFGVFGIQIDLSPEGLEHTEEIVALIFAYIGMLRKVGVQRWIHDELQLKSAIQFRFQDKQTPLNLAQTAAEELQRTPMNDILSSRYLIEEFKPDRITELLNMLTPQNFYYCVVAQKFAGQEGNTHEPVYSTEMNISKIEDSSIKKFQEAMENGHPSFHLPEKNTFIATKFDLKPREEKNSPIPELLCDTDYLRLWFLQDDEYKLPKAVTKISITTPMVAHDPKTTLLSNLWIWCFTQYSTDDLELHFIRKSENL
ncbi:hypothetical protein WR25_24247 [Diploscapter pachys]|uniref:Peptidase M16 N-terminal domain-containing protein n=1 Tax=Diploscapter pachys TaxID=2018661 RepID=A0A2A2LJZ0_9BILA|nr:hypothetical protein WR25_24247 [Diploscapter pachys]